MTIKIISTGKIKHAFISETIRHYEKLLSKYCKCETVECPDISAPESLLEKQKQNVLAREGKKLLAAMRGCDYTIALDIKGEKLDSRAFADKLSVCMTGGASTIGFVIGGSLGLSEEVLRVCDYKLSFSDMTFSHQIFRAMLTEQLYRAFTIINGHPYHK